MISNRSHPPCSLNLVGSKGNKVRSSRNLQKPTSRLKRKQKCLTLRSVPSLLRLSIWMTLGAESTRFRRIRLKMRSTGDLMEPMGLTWPTSRTSDPQNPTQSTYLPGNPPRQRANSNWAPLVSIARKPPSQQADSSWAPLVSTVICHRHWVLTTTKLSLSAKIYQLTKHPLLAAPMTADRTWLRPRSQPEGLPVVAYNCTPWATTSCWRPKHCAIMCLQA